MNGFNDFPPSSHKGIITALAFSADGALLATADGFKTIKVWDAVEGKEVASLTGHQGLIEALAFAPDGRTVAAADGMKVIILWDFVAKQPGRTFGPYGGGVTGLAFSPDGGTLVETNGGYGPGELRLLDPASGAEKKVLSPSAAPAFHDTLDHTVVSRDGKALATAAGPQSVHVYGLPECKVRFNVPTVAGCLAFSPDGAALAVQRVNGVDVYDAAGGDKRGSVEGEGGIGAAGMAFSADGRLLLAAVGGHEIGVWEVASGKQRALVRAPGFQHMAFSPERRILALPASEGKILLWDVSKLLE